MTTTQSLSATTAEKPKVPPPPPPPPPAARTSGGGSDDSSDEEFDVAWQRRAKLQARKEAASAAPVEIAIKRNVHFLPSVHDPMPVIELDFEEATESGFQQSTQDDDLVVSLDDEDDDTQPATTQSRITMVNFFPVHTH